VGRDGKGSNLPPAFACRGEINPFFGKKKGDRCLPKPIMDKKQKKLKTKNPKRDTGRILLEKRGEREGEEIQGLNQTGWKTFSSFKPPRRGGKKGEGNPFSPPGGRAILRWGEHDA